MRKRYFYSCNVYVSGIPGLIIAHESGEVILEGPEHIVNMTSPFASATQVVKDHIDKVHDQIMSLQINGKHLHKDDLTYHFTALHEV